MVALWKVLAMYRGAYYALRVVCGKVVCGEGESVGVVGSPCLQSEEGVGDCGECVG